MIDLDACLYCDNCKDIIALVETTQDKQQEKPTTILCTLAALCHRPAYLIYYTATVEDTLKAFTRIFAVYPARQKLASDWQAIEGQLRRAHVCKRAAA